MRKLTLLLSVAALALSVAGLAWAQPGGLAAAGGGLENLEAQLKVAGKQLRAAQEKAGIFKNEDVVKLAADLKAAQTPYDARVAELSTANPKTAELQKTVNELAAKLKPGDAETEDKLEAARKELHKAQVAAGIFKDEKVVALGKPLAQAQKAYDAKVGALSMADPAISRLYVQVEDMKQSIERLRKQTEEAAEPKEK